MNQRPNCSGLDNSGHETTYQASTKRIAKNTLMLYFRQILILLVSLYTVRVVLNTLGAEDYGIYNVVAGVVVLFSFVNNAMATATQRFLNYSLGENDKKKTQEVYSASLIVHLGIAAIFVLLAETVGLWFVSNKLNIPEARRAATAIVYQFTIITTVFNILRVPYNAVIIAYEKMSFFAWLSILESLLKLAIVFLLVLSGIDRLVFYAFLMTAVALIILCFYKLYCNRTFEIARYSKVTDISLVKKILSFSGWSLFGAVANVANSQGTNIVLNMFTNVTVNAAMGIANQVNSAVYSFVGNFQTAFNPQIVKSYASNDSGYFINLVCRTSKFSFFLLFFIAFPLYVNAEFILTIWLKNVPEFTVPFVRLILIWSLIEAINGPLFMAIQSTGKIKIYQLIVGMINLSNIPLLIFSFSVGGGPLWLMYIKISLNLFALVFRIYLCYKLIGLPVKRFVLDSLFRPFLVCILSVICLLFCKQVLVFFKGLSFVFVTTIACFIFTCISIFIFGMTKTEFDGLKSYIFHKKICRRK